MHWIAEHAFDGVLPEERKKQRGLDLLQLLVLLTRSQAMEALQVLQPLAVDLLRRRFALIAELRRGILFKRHLGVAIAVSSPGSSYLPVDIDSYACFPRARTRFIAPNDS